MSEINVSNREPMDQSPMNQSGADQSGASQDGSAGKRSGLGRSLLRTTFARGGSALGTIVMNIVLARVLTKADFGTYMVCLTALLTISMLVRFGIDPAMMRYGGMAFERNDMKEFRGLAYWGIRNPSRNAAIFAIISVLVLQLFVGPRWEGTSIMTWMMIALLPLSLLYVISYIFKGAHRAPLGSLFEVGTVGTGVAIVMSVAHFAKIPVDGTTASIALLVCSIGLAIAGFAAMSLSGIGPRRDDNLQVDRAEFSTYCRDNAVIQLFQILANWGAAFYLYLFWTAEEAADFTGPARFAAVSILLMNIVVYVTAPRMAGLRASGSNDALRRLIQRSSIMVAAATTPMLAILMVGSPWVLMLLGPKYVDAWPVLSLIAGGQLIGILAGLAPTVLLMSGYESQWKTASLISISFCIVLTGVLSYFYGAIGAAIGTALFQAVNNWVAAFLVHRNLGYWMLSMGSLFSSPRPEATS
jgi:O-antigen/teichoic acid export membrane protein